MEGNQTFQGVNLTGSIQGKVAKCGGSTSESIQSKIETFVSLTTMQGLCKRFGMLLGTKNQASETSNYNSKRVVSDMLVFNIDSWPTIPGDLLDFGREEVMHLTVVLAYFRESRLQDLCYSRSVDLSENSSQRAVPQT